MKKYMAFIGDPHRGYRLYGPFDEPKAAMAFGFGHKQDASLKVHIEEIPDTSTTWQEGMVRELGFAEVLYSNTNEPTAPRPSSQAEVEARIPVRAPLTLSAALEKVVKIADEQLESWRAEFEQTKPSEEEAIDYNDHVESVRIMALYLTVLRATESSVEQTITEVNLRFMPTEGGIN